jgi:hypothetical protein
MLYEYRVADSMFCCKGFITWRSLRNMRPSKGEENIKRAEAKEYFYVTEPTPEQREDAAIARALEHLDKGPDDGTETVELKAGDAVQDLISSDDSAVVTSALTDPNLFVR